MEVLGTLVGAAIQGQIVASAHTKKHCPIHNISAGHLGNGSGTEIVRSLLPSQDYMSHSVSVTCAERGGPGVLKPGPKITLSPAFTLGALMGAQGGCLQLAKVRKQSPLNKRQACSKLAPIFTDCLKA